MTEDTFDIRSEQSAPTSTEKEFENALRPLSFRFHLAMDTLAFGCMIPAIRAHWGLAPVS